MLDDQGKRDFTSAVPGTRLVGDITYLRTGEGWLYLATVIDLFSGMVIGWSMAEHMRASLCTAALQMARNHGRFSEQAVVFHSDRGTQYTSEEFQKWCGTNGVTQSMGKVGECWDNAVAENFFSHLKTEFYHHERLVQARGPDRRHGLHRRLVQPPPTQPPCRRHTTSHRPYRLPNHRSGTPGRLTNNNENCPKNLTSAGLERLPRKQGIGQSWYSACRPKVSWTQRMLFSVSMNQAHFSASVVQMWFSVLRSGRS